MSVRKATLIAASLAFAATAMAGEGTVKGTAKWDSKPKKQKKLKVDGEPYCAQMYSAEPLRSEKMVCNSNATLKNIFVYVKSGLPAGKTWDAPSEPVVLDQKGCHYEPHVFGVMAGQEILVRNSDPIAHNINATPKNSEGFNNGQPKQGMEFLKKFDNTEIGVTIKCDVHSWMSSYAHVMDHPFWAVTDESGNFEIKGLPAGEYVLSTWSEEKRIAAKDMTITVGDGETKEAHFDFKKVKK
jgi:plastocyanin